MRIKEGYKVRNIAGENVIVAIGTLNVNFTKIISLNDTSVWLWEELEGKEFDAEKVAEMLVSQYEIDHGTALADSKEWIASLDKAGLLEK